jgi:hypothetical protein
MITYALIPVEGGCSAKGYCDVYKKGDRWMEIRSCDPKCGRNCCTNCKLHIKEVGCRIHYEGNKPVYCAVWPHPNSRQGQCTLVWYNEETKQYRFASDDANVLRDEGP